MEFKTRKEILCWVHRDTVCTYEMNGTPPFMIDETGLDIAMNRTVDISCIRGLGPRLRSS